MAADDLESIRAELRRRGYLQRGVDRVLLQDALRPRGAGAAVARLAVRVGVPVGAALAVAAGSALAQVNGNLRSDPGDAAVLAAHLLLPSVAVACVAFALLYLLLMPLVRTARGGFYAAAAAVSVSLATLVAAGLRGREIAAGSRLAAVWVAITAAALAWLCGRFLYAGLIALRVRSRQVEDARPLIPRRMLAAVAAGGAAVLVVPALVAVASPPAPAPFLPSAPGERVLLVGVDGVLAEEFEYLLARGDLPAIAARRANGSVLLRYARPEGPPASLWTTVATGLEPAGHGVVGVDSYRPAGVALPLSRSGVWRAWWRLESALGLCEHRAVLAARRSGWTFWELAARGGAPVASINWWSTFPADALPGLVLAHGAYQLLAERAAGAVEPASRAAELRALRESDGVAALDAHLGAALPTAGAADVLERAVRPDLFYLAAARLALAESPRAASLYLPGLDIAAAQWRGSDVAFADLVRATLLAADRWVGDAEGFSTVVVVADPGRRGGAEGRVLLLRRGCGGEGVVAPAQVAASLVRALGLPQSAELPEPTAACSWPSPPATVARYGERRAPAAAGAGAEYLENLKALGYL